MAAVDSRKALRKFKFERQVGRTIVNPLVAALDKIGIRGSSTVELETTGVTPGDLYLSLRNSTALRIDSADRGRPWPYPPIFVTEH